MGIAESIGKHIERAKLEYELFKVLYTYGESPLKILAQSASAAMGTAGLLAMAPLPVKANVVHERVIDNYKQDYNGMAVDANDLQQNSGTVSSITGIVISNRGNYLDGNPVKAWVTYANGQQKMHVDTLKNGKMNMQTLVTGIGDDAGENIIIPTKARIELTDLLGRQLAEKEIDAYRSKGDVPIDMSKYAAGVYFARVTVTDMEGNDLGQFVQKIGYVDKRFPVKYVNVPVVTRKMLKASLRKMEGGDAKLDSIAVEGENIVRKTFTGPFTFPLPASYDVGTLVVDEKNMIVVGPVYDLDTKFDPFKKTLQGLLVFLGSNPGNRTKTDANGIAVLYTAKIGKDSVFVIDTTATDTTGYYNWKNPEINIVTGQNVVKAFNDITGIPTWRRYVDPDNREDELEHLQKMTDVQSSWLNDPIFKNTKPRVRDQDLVNRKVFLNKDKIPATIVYLENMHVDSVSKQVYLDSIYSAFKGLETNRKKYIETDDSTQAIYRIYHNGTLYGKGIKIIPENDEKGPYLAGWWIALRGPSNPSSGQYDRYFLSPRDVIRILRHELIHGDYTSGVHSDKEKDIMHASPLVNKGSTKETNAGKRIDQLERNPKLLNYSK